MTSGKGGVGKTSICCNLAVALGKAGQRVLLIDADLGLANVDIVLGITPVANLAQFFSGEAALETLLVDGPRNVTVLPASSGVSSMTHLEDAQVLRLADALGALPNPFDVVLVDTGAGIGANVRRFNSAVEHVIVVTTTEPTAVTDAYATMKVLRNEQGIKRFRLLVNQAANKKAALRIYRHLTEVADRFLDLSIEFLGFVPADPSVSRAVVERSLLIEHAPNAPAAQAISHIAERIRLDEQLAPAASGGLQFFWKRLVGLPDSTPKV
jgi:flagellar biosynthesis protein FlhG